VIRTDIRPGDIGSIIKLHGEYYLDKNGLDYTFEPYVAIPISEFVLKNNKRERIWIVENNNEVVGSIAITQLKTKVAQLRWYILRDEYHGKGLGKELICKAIDFAKEMKYSRIILWTISDLGTAIKMYTKNGFKFRTRLSSEV
jgi:GNAT superfamily N-acetyltransferase